MVINMQTENKSEKKLICSNIAKPGSKVLFKEKIGKLNKGTIGFAAGHGISFDFFNNLLHFNTPSILRPDIEPSTNKKGLNNPCIDSYFLITRVGKTGKFRFQLLSIKMPIFNSSLFRLVNSGLGDELSKTQIKLLGSENPLIVNYHNDEESFINEPTFFDARKNMDNDDFLCWAVSKCVSLKLAGLNVTKRRFFNNTNYPNTGNNVHWRTINQIGTELIRVSEKDPEHMNNIAKELGSHETKSDIVHSLQVEYSKNSRVLNIHLQNLLAWSFLVHRNLMNYLVNMNKKELSSQEKKLLETYKEDKGIDKLDKFLSKALAAVHPTTKETKNKEKQKMYTKINNRFL